MGRERWLWAFLENTVCHIVTVNITLTLCLIIPLFEEVEGIISAHSYSWFLMRLINFDCGLVMVFAKLFLRKIILRPKMKVTSSKEDWVCFSQLPRGTTSERSSLIWFKS